MIDNRFLCRGKRVDNGEWAEGCVIHCVDCAGSACAIHVPAKDPDHYNHAYCIQDTTLGQCTGLKDKNDKLIFEGDIVTNGVYKYVVVFHCGEWLATLISNKMIQLRVFYATSELEIIGNIHDNPEMLEVEE